jgi:hypothetical protein
VAEDEPSRELWLRDIGHVTSTIDDVVRYRAALRDFLEAKFADVVREGVLFKRGCLFSGWKKRLYALISSNSLLTLPSFRLRRTMLYYFAQPRDVRAAGSIDVQDCSIEFGEGGGASRPHSFRIVHPHRRTFVLAAESDEDMRAWVGLLAEVAQM